MTTYPTPAMPLGLTDSEKEVLALLGQAYNKFVTLEGKHPADDTEFTEAIHAAQKMVALRVARRIDQDVWTQFD